MSDKQSGNSGELKPCPICGSDGHKWDNSDTVDCLNGKCAAYKCAMSLMLWQSIPRQSDTVREVIREMKDLERGIKREIGYDVWYTMKLRRLSSRLSTAVEPERDRVHGEVWVVEASVSCAATEIIGVYASHADADETVFNCTSYARKGKYPVHGTPTGDKPPERDRVPGEVWVVQYQDGEICVCANEREFRALTTGMGSSGKTWSKVPVHGTPTGDGETCDECEICRSNSQYILGGTSAVCMDCYKRALEDEETYAGTPTCDGEKTWVQCNVCGSTGWRCEHCSPATDECESCEKPEQWEALHTALWAYSGALDRKQWSLEGAYSSLREHMRMVREVSESTKGDISAYYNGQCASEDMHNKTKDELDAAKDQLATRKSEVERVIDAANARIDEGDDRFREHTKWANTRIAELESDLASESAWAKEYFSKWEQAKARIEELEADLNRFRVTQKDNLAGRIKAERRYTERIAELEKDVEELKAALRSCLGALDNLMGDSDIEGDDSIEFKAMQKGWSALSGGK